MCFSATKQGQKFLANMRNIFSQELFFRFFVAFKDKQSKKQKKKLLRIEKKLVKTKKNSYKFRKKIEYRTQKKIYL